MGENHETLVWLRFARRCHYIDNDTYKDLAGAQEEIGRLLGYMLANPIKFGIYKLKKQLRICFS